MSVELILLGVIIILCGLLGWEKRENRLEHAKLINALLAKNAQEMVNLDLADKTQIKTQVPVKEDLVPEADLDQEEWEKVIRQ